jgi:hypothetical protein
MIKMQNYSMAISHVSRAIRIAVVALAFASSQLGQQGGVPSRRQRPLSSLELRTLLTQPGGLDKAAKKFGEFMVDGDVTSIITFSDLADLVDESPFIVKGTLTQINSRLIYDENEIFTDCTLRPDEVLKGKIRSGDIKFVVRGGRIVFPNGTSAEIKTRASTFFVAGSRYLVMLRTDSDTGEYALQHHLESAFRITESGEIDALAAHEERRREIVDDIGSQRAETVLSRVRQIVAKK